MNGSDSERMIAEIETFLKTGSAPPPAPEPQHPQVPWGPRRSASRPLEPMDFGRRAPRWTALRVAVVVCMLAGLLLLPVVYSDHLNGEATPLGPPAAASGYTFLRLNPSGTPVRWDPCSTVYYVTNLAGAPGYAAVDLQLAVEKISQATGLLFADVGSTAAAPPAYGRLGAAAGVQASATAGSVAQRGSGGPGTGQEPVLVEWTPAGGLASLSTTRGYAKTVPVAAVDPTTGDAVYVSGSVVIDSAAAGLAHGFGPHSLGVLLLHELGRLVGLGPVTARGEIMNPHVLSSRTDSLGSGDLAGLKRLGVSAGCLTVPARPTLEPTS